jgi:hypothetical protein
MTKFAPGGRRGAGGAERSEPVRLTVYGHHTRALFAMKVQHKLRNGVAGRIISGSAESGQNLPSQRCCWIRKTSARRYRLR